MVRRLGSAGARGGAGALGLGRTDWSGAAALGRRALGWAALAGAMFLLSRARFGGLAPFAMAFLSAALLAGKGAAALLVGCLAGALGGTLGSFDLRLPVGAAIVLGGGIARDYLKPMLDADAAVGRALRRVRAAVAGRDDARRPAPNRLARSPNDGAACSALAGAGVLLPGLLMPGEPLTVPLALEATAASVAAVAAAPFLKAALERGRRDAARREGLFLLAGLVCLGLARLTAPVAVWAAGLATLLLYPGGALAGAGLGGALLLATNDPRLLAVLAAGGATAQLCESLSKNARNFGACGAMVAAGLWLNLSPATLAGALLPALTALPMPEEWARGFLLLSRSPDDPRRKAEAARRRAAKKLAALAAVLGEGAVTAQTDCVRRVLEGLADELLCPAPRRRPRLRVEKGAACAPREAGVPSGDSHLICKTDGARLLALISDGMGSGPDAARESAAAARLVGRLARSGAPLEMAAEAANALLLGRFGEDMFATLDALSLDLATGEATLVKLAACPTLILRRDGLARVAGERLPLGILEGVRPRAARLRLRPGDTVLMMSDGVADALGPGEPEDLLVGCAGLSPPQIAEKVLLAAQRAPAHADDRTVVCLRVESLD